MKTLLTVWAIGCVCGALFVTFVPVLGPYLWYPLYCRLRPWWQRNRPSWSTAKRRIRKYLSGKHIRYLAGIIAGYLLAIVVFALFWVALVISTPQ